jgi:hypothetical protein
MEGVWVPKRLPSFMKGKIMSEPRVDDDIALGKDDSCENCDERLRDCECYEPDVCYDEFYND